MNRLKVRQLSHRRLLIRPLVLVVALTVLTACSGMRFVYNQLDWLIPFYLADYIRLDDDQSVQLDRQVDQFLAWHCRTQVPEYALFFRTVLDDAREGRYQAAVLRSHFETVSQYWYTMADEAARHLAEVLADATDKQIQQLSEKMLEDQADYKEEFVTTKPAEIREAINEQMVKRIERWIGDLEPEQTELVDQWADKAIAAQAERFLARVKWQEALHKSFQLRGQDKAAFVQEFQLVFKEPQRIWTESYAELIEQYRASIFTLLENILSRMTKQQKAQLVERLDAMASDLQLMSCAANSGASGLER